MTLSGRLSTGKQPTTHVSRLISHISTSMGLAGAPTRFHKVPLFKHDEEDPEEVYHIEVKPEWLSVDKNVLAIEFHNEWIKSSDACAVPLLTAKMVSN